MQSGAVSTGSQVTSTTITLSAPVLAVYLLVGWFGQYAASRQVQVFESQRRLDPQQRLHHVG